MVGFILTRICGVAIGIDVGDGIAGTIGTIGRPIGYGAMVDAIFLGLQIGGRERSQGGFFAAVGATVGDGSFDLALHTLVAWLAVLCCFRTK